MILTLIVTAHQVVVVRTIQILRLIRWTFHVHLYKIYFVFRRNKLYCIITCCRRLNKIHIQCYR